MSEDLTRRAFAVNNDLFSIGHPVFPRKIVVVVYAGDGLFAQSFCQVVMNLVVASFRIITRQIHAHPVLLTRFTIEREPGQLLGFAG